MSKPTEKYLKQGDWCLNTINGYVNLATPNLDVYPRGASVTSFLKNKREQLDKFAERWGLEGGQAPGNCKEKNYTVYIENQEYWVHPVFAFETCMSRGRQILNNMLDSIGYKQFSPPEAELIENTDDAPASSTDENAIVTTNFAAHNLISMPTSNTSYSLQNIKEICAFVGEEKSVVIRELIGDLVAQDLKKLLKNSG